MAKDKEGQRGLGQGAVSAARTMKTGNQHQEVKIPALPGGAVLEEPWLGPEVAVPCRKLPAASCQVLTGISQTLK